MTKTDQGKQNSALQLQSRLLIYSALGALGIGASVAIASIMPLSERLKQAEERNLEFAAQTRTLAIEEFLLRTQDIGGQISSRTRARNQLAAYNQGQVKRNELVQVSTAILTDALNQSEDIKGIMRFDAKGQPVTQIGLAIPEEFWQVMPSEGNPTVFMGPVDIAGISYLIVGTLINNQTAQVIGRDLVLFEVSRLERIIQNYSGLGATGEIILGTVKNGKVQRFFQTRNNTNRISMAVENAIKMAVGGEAGLMQSDAMSDIPEVIAFNPIALANWGLAVKMDRQELYQPVQKQILDTGIAIAILTLLGTGGMVILLRPLTNKAIVQTDELEQQIQEKSALLQVKTAALQTEQRQRRAVEEALQQMNELKASSRQVAEACATANFGVQDAQTIATAGTRSVARTLEGMTTLKDNVEAIALQIDHLHEGARQIGTIASLVGSLADQTNMLALNAAVEAVRAGDRGKGFSVIATEIRKLADRSRQSADKINILLEDIQSSVVATSKATAEGTKTVQVNFEIVQETAVSLTGVLQAIEEVTTSAQEISLATHEQAVAIQQLVAAIDLIQT
ncbi:methyl-accepting chemotaxis protein [Laspinema sp. A4]|uniref:methyl-accepting chemotaxis protein n=1 Tax=Laspinema sp. D2d TaxID=2953686 RepID=UPI0021BB8E9F|nr:methyl-accepting chemotaxis protein [Laspinema sp. D2d]MCT7981913.1 methyl-accepting chemotaxis protein [Laspinema sp. D2d]